MIILLFKWKDRRSAKLLTLSLNERNSSLKLWEKQNQINYFISFQEGVLITIAKLMSYNLSSSRLGKLSKK